jgi:predicted metal-dependent phosphoesterase TrpH
MQEAFDRYLAAGRPAYVPGERLSMAEALPVMRRSGFVPVLAHPLLLGKEDHVLRMLVDSWKQQGLMGVEAYHPSAAPGRDAMLDRLARSMGLLVTGGSDYHCDDNRHGQPGSTCLHWHQAGEDVAALLQAMDEQSKR